MANHLLRRKESGHPIMARYVGLWHGGPSYSSGYWETDAELFDSLDHASAVLADRYALGFVFSPRNVPRVAEWITAPDGEDYARAGEVNHNLRCPCVTRESYLVLAQVSRSLRDIETGGPSYVLTIGPRGGVRVESA